MASPERLDFSLLLALVLSIVASVGLVAAVPADTAASPATPVDSCTTITEPGVYVLTTDLKDNKDTRISESCIEIQTDDVVFDGDGHIIDGKGISDTRGVSVNASAEATNVTVRNLTVSDWNVGVFYQSVSGGEIQSVNASGNAYGINLDDSTDVEVRENSVSHNLVGIDLLRGNADVTVTNNTVEDNHLVGVYTKSNE